MYVNFGDVARSIGMQCQYACRYVQPEWAGEYPNLAAGLRFRNLTSASYHDIEIHVDDVEDFKARLQRERG